jgi:hypothetical protein
MRLFARRIRTAGCAHLSEVQRLLLDLVRVISRGAPGQNVLEAISTADPVTL